MDKIKNVVTKMVFILSIIWLILVTYCSIFFVNQSNMGFTVGTLILLGACLIVFFIYSINKMLFIYEEMQGKLNKFLLILIFILTIFWALRIRSIAPWDLRTIQNDVITYLNTNNHPSIDYFQCFPNNIPIAIIYCIWYKITMAVGLETSIANSILGILCINITIWFGYLSIKQICSKNIGTLFLVVILINQPIFLYISYVYTDVLSMPFASLGIYFFIKFCVEDSNTAINFGRCLITTLFLYFGFKIRATIIIPIIAICIYLILNSAKNFIKFVVCLCTSAIIVTMLLNIGIKVFNYEINKNDSYPISFFIITGLNQEYYGNFNSDDLAIAQSYADGQERTEEINKIMLSRIMDIIDISNISKSFDFFLNKISRVWSSGTYGYETYLQQISPYYGKLYNLTIGPDKNSWVYILQTIRVAMYIVVLFGVLFLFRDEKIGRDISTVFILIILGGGLFYLFWEAQNRYSFSFIIYICFLVCIVFEKVLLRSDNYIKGKNSIVTKKIIFVMLYIYAVVLYNRIYYVQDKFYVIAQQQCLWNTDIVEINQEGIEQEFLATESFDYISLKLNNSNIDEEDKYAFEIIHNGEIVEKQEFSSKIIMNNERHLFCFDRINCENNKNKYYIKLYKLSNNNNKLYCYIDNLDFFDCYSEGGLIIDGSKAEHDIDFFVGRHEILY